MRDSFYAEFFADMLPKVHRFVRARFPSPMAEDLASETMLRLWDKQIQVPGTEAELLQLRALTYQIAFRLIANTVRKSGREAEVLERGMLRVIPSDDPTFEAVVPIALQQAIARLDVLDQQAIHLRLAGFRTSEIAEFFGIAPKAASMRLARARTRLARHIPDNEEGTGDEVGAQR